MREKGATKNGHGVVEALTEANLVLETVANRWRVQQAKVALACAGQGLVSRKKETGCKTEAMEWSQHFGKVQAQS